MIVAEGGEALALAAEATDEFEVQGLMADVTRRHGCIDILHNNVGASIALGDAVVTEITEEAFDRSFTVNLKSHWLTAKYALPALRETHGPDCKHCLARRTAGLPVHRLQDHEDGRGGTY